MDLIVKKKLKYTYNKVLVVESLYSIALYIYINKNKVNDTLFLVGDNIYFPEIFQEIPNYIVYKRERAEFNYKEKILRRLNIIPIRFENITAYVHGDFKIFGHDHLNISLLFDIKTINIIEDGIANYTIPRKIKFFRKCILKILNIPVYKFGFGSGNGKIYLTKIKEPSEEIRRKINLINRETFLENLPSLLNAKFSYHLSIPSKFQLIITQPWSEDKYTTESRKVELYKSLINQELPIVIKAHPREITNYSAYFPNAYIIPNYVLSETLFNHKNLSEVITFNSSGVFNYAFRKEIKITMCHIDIESLSITEAINNIIDAKKAKLS